MESVAGCSWNGWPDARGIRTAVHDRQKSAKNGHCVAKKQGVFSLSLVLLLSQLYRRGKAKSWRLGANGPDLLQLQECV